MNKVAETAFKVLLTVGMICATIIMIKSTIMFLRLPYPF